MRNKEQRERKEYGKSMGVYKVQRGDEKVKGIGETVN